MATLLTDQSAVARTPNRLTASSSNAVINTSEFLFYSNNPETLDSSDLADNGRYLNMANVTGNGQIYIWHANQTGQTIKHCILIYNPNNYAVTVTATNYGLTNTSNTGASDAEAWEDYYNGQSTSVTVAAGSYGNLFLSTVYNNRNFGIVARVKIVKNGTTTASSVTLYDLAYTTNSGGAQSIATAESYSDTKRPRGKGNGYYTALTFPVVTPTDTNGVGYTFGSSTDSFSGADIVYITDGSGQASGLLEGAYGQQFYITIPIKNTTNTARKFRIYIGSRGGYAFPFVNFAGSIAKYTSRIASMNYVDIIETDTIASGNTVNISFSTVITAMASAPYFVGIRTI